MTHCASISRYKDHKMIYCMITIVMVIFISVRAIKAIKVARQAKLTQQRNNIKRVLHDNNIKLMNQVAIYRQQARERCPHCEANCYYSLHVLRSEMNRSVSEIESELRRLDELDED